MIQYTINIQGVHDAKDEQVILESARRLLGTERVSISALTAALTVEAESALTEECLEVFSATLASLGYVVMLPPIVKEPATESVEEAIPPSASESGPKKEKRSWQVPMSVFISSVCAVLVLAILGTWAVTSEIFHRRLVDANQQNWGDTAKPDDGESPSEPTLSENFYELEVLKMIFDQYAIEDIDDEALKIAVLKAYAIGTGDIYAEYYTAEELEQLMSDNQGEMDGIGVSVVNDVVEINGFEYSVLNIISVFEDSPALEAGIRMGDCVYMVENVDGEEVTVESLGYDNAISCVRGPSGTKANFAVLRFSSDGSFELIPFSITRAPITSESVRGRVLESDHSIGIVKISQFDLTTPTQFKSTMDSLVAQGCTKFVFDVRYNPGGALQSIEAVLSTLLNEGDLMISTVYKTGETEQDYVRVVDYAKYDGYEGCSVTSEDIGKYRGYKFAVLTNEYTASAAELFTSNLRDYDLATIVGVTTYGKGCMQTTFNLGYYGMDGALKLTTAWYQPPSGENYHDVGIAPDIEVATDEALIEQYGNVYLIPDEVDPQLQAAIKALK